ncbi:3-hydroxyacyl-ACP dehydratase FabZ family protein [Changchengzhania lutea]|uniref:3-hydroxyacyl-ACP dehydratase FabZ family protein n=1 Tax=Changchengzhania lutea TaxID=2049305 RepID=UPI00115D07D0|nr:hydroxymyristoyl-ACP dehydratase [Changchengzhania lutea]
MDSDQIINLLPYQKPFLFVDGLTSVSEHNITGHYTFKKDEYFYKGHFKNKPVTPGVILTECMAQIGVVCLGIYIMKNQSDNYPDSDVNQPQIALTSSSMDFFLPVLPGERITVTSEKEVFRFNKLKCKVKMYNDEGELVCRGDISGMMNP